MAERTLLGADRPLFAVLVPLVARDGDALSAVNVSLARTLGVFAGVFLGLGLRQLDLPSTTLVALLLVLSLAAGVVLRVKDGPLNNQVAITALFMLYVGASQRAQMVGVARIWETALGAGLAVAVSTLVWPPDPLGTASPPTPDRPCSAPRSGRGRPRDQAAPDGRRPHCGLRNGRSRPPRAPRSSTA